LAEASIEGPAKLKKAPPEGHPVTGGSFFQPFQPLAPQSVERYAEGWNAVLDQRLYSGDPLRTCEGPQMFSLQVPRAQVHGVPRHGVGIQGKEVLLLSNFQI